MNYTENLTLGLPEYGEDADVADLNRNSGILDAYCYNTRQIECEPYDPDPNRNPPYMSGDLAIHNEVVYECNTDNTTGTWDDSKWDSTTLAEQIAKAKQSGGESEFADLDDVSFSNLSNGQTVKYNTTSQKWENTDFPDTAVTKEATGNPIELTDAASAPLVKCVTQITGSQDLHGYDKPWVGGAGKNKLPMTVDGLKSANTSGTWSGNAYAYNGCTFTILVDDSNNVIGIKVTGTASADITFVLYSNVQNVIAPGTSVTMNGCPANGSSITYRMYAYTIGYDYGSGVTNNIPSTQCACGITVFSGFALPTDGLIFYPMIRLSTESDSTFAPYSNICPITAYTEGEIEVSDGDGNTTTHTTTYPSAIYRGSEDVVNGEVKSEWPVIDLGDLTWQKTSVSPAITRFFTYDISTLIKAPTAGTQKANIICENFSTETANDLISGIVDNCIAIGTTGTLIARVSGEDSLTAEQFKTYVTGIKIAFELATPTTSSVTPTNLPIKSLSGYNHIESSTGEMEVEYITEEYQPLVDLIQSGNGHTYSTQEQVVGKWIDGSTLYEKTIYCNGLSGTSDWTELDSSVAYGKLISADGVRVKTNECFSFSNSLGSDPRFQTKTDNKLYYYTSSTVDGDMYITFRYTKPTTTRSLNTSLTSQKAQIEPLIAEEEEVPTEEEKAVNEEENNDETR